MSSKSPIRLKKSPSIKVRKMGMVALRQKTRFSITGVLSKTVTNNNIHDYKHLSGIVKYGFLCYSEKEIKKNRR